MHNRSCADGNGYAVHERLGYGRWGTQVDPAPSDGPAWGLGWSFRPIGVSALSASPSHYWGAAASLVTAARMVGMALGLAALSAWGIERFYSLTAHVTIGSTFEETEAPLIEAGVTVFQNLFAIAGFLSLLAILPALLMRVESAEEVPESAPAAGP